MFVVANPLVPFLALVNNLIEIRVDASKLCYLTQRPQPRSASGIGTNNDCLHAYLNQATLGTLLPQPIALDFRQIEKITMPVLMRARTVHYFRRFLAADLAVHGDARCGDQLCDNQLHKT
jgi:hypothetical protein